MADLLYCSKKYICICENVCSNSELIEGHVRESVSSCSRPDIPPGPLRQTPPKPNTSTYIRGGTNAPPNNGGYKDIRDMRVEPHNVSTLYAPQRRHIAQFKRRHIHISQPRHAK